MSKDFLDEKKRKSKQRKDLKINQEVLKELTSVYKIITY
jgi:hypothetical protein